MDSGLLLRLLMCACVCLCVCVCFRDVLGTVCITSPFNHSELSPLLPSETVDRLELDCLNSVRVRERHIFSPTLLTVARITRLTEQGPLFCTHF